MANLANDYIDTLKIDSVSPTSAEAKKGYFGILLDRDITEYATMGWGFVKGFVGSILNNIIPIGLLAASVALRKRPSAQKWFLGLFSLCAGKQLIFNNMDIKGRKYLPDE